MRIGAGVHIGAMRDQHLRRFRMIFLGRPNQRGLAVRIALGVDVSAVFDEKPHDLRIPGAGGGHQNRAAVREASRWHPRRHSSSASAMAAFRLVAASESGVTP